jgi:hypothetical protein
MIAAATKCVIGDDPSAVAIKCTLDSPMTNTPEESITKSANFRFRETRSFQIKGSGTIRISPSVRTCSSVI